MPTTFFSGNIVSKTGDDGITYVSIGDNVVVSTPFKGIAYSIKSLLMSYDDGDGEDGVPHVTDLDLDNEL